MILCRIEMEKDINSFMNKMEQFLDQDMLKYIVDLVHKENNMNTIVKTKKLKRQLNNSIIKLFHTFYIDQNVLIYKLNDEHIVLENLRPSVNPNLSIYQKNNNERNVYNANENSVVIPCSETQLQNIKLCVLYD